MSSVFSIKGNTVFITGEEYLPGPDHNSKSGPVYAADHETAAGLRAGAFLCSDVPRLQVTDKVWMSGQDGPGGLFIRLKALSDFSISQGLELSIMRKGFSLAWITLSDKGARGQRVDESGPLIQEICSSGMDISLARGWVIPDDSLALRALLVHLSLTAGFDLVITTGGTGLGPRDITPEATLKVIDKRLPGFERAMVSSSLNKTPHAMISRAVAGTLGLSLIMNLPGSPKGVRENLETAVPALEHALKKLQGDKSDCAPKV